MHLVFHYYRSFNLRFMRRILHHLRDRKKILNRARNALVLLWFYQDITVRKMLIKDLLLLVDYKALDHLDWNLDFLLVLRLRLIMLLSLLYDNTHGFIIKCLGFLLKLLLNWITLTLNLLSMLEAWIETNLARLEINNKILFLNLRRRLIWIKLGELFLNFRASV